MNPIDDDTLQAYVDGELDAAGAARIDAALTHDEVLARRVQQAHALRAQLKAAFDPVLEEPVPEHLAAMLRPTPPHAEIPARAVAASTRQRGFGGSRRRAPRRWLVPAAVAASIAALTVSLWWKSGSDLVRMHDGQQFAAGTLSRALDKSLASEPDPNAPISIGLTFRSADGRICRTFTERAKPAMAGLACHGDAGWSLPVLTAAESSAGGALRQAASDLPPKLQAAIDARIRGDAFNAQQERAARNAGWH